MIGKVMMVRSGAVNRAPGMARAWIAAMAWGFFGGAIDARAADVAAPGIQDLIRTPELDVIRFSPDGKRFAARVERQGQLVLVVVDAATQKGQAFRAERGSDLASFRWVTDDLLRISTTKLGVRAFDQTGADYQTSYMGVDGKPRFFLDKYSTVSRQVPGPSGDLVVGLWRGGSDHGTLEMQLIDGQTGQLKRTLTEEPPGPRISGWVLDPQLVPRAAIGFNDSTGRVETWHRDAGSTKWQPMSNYMSGAARRFYPVAVDVDGELIVVSNIASGRDALHRFDRATGAPGELMAGHAKVDIGADDLILDRLTHLPLGVRIEAEKTRYVWFDERHAKAQQVVDASLPDSVNGIQLLPDGRVLVHATSDVEPGSYYFYDPAARSMSQWSRAMPWLKPEQLSRTELWEYQARDGLPIPAYVTWPRLAAAGDKVPLVVWLHGGPAGRDEWGFDPFVQFLAARGYAVLQVNFRGSTGYGRRFEVAGHRQWGLKMHDDVIDGVQALVARGRIDAKRMCIGGASYGGYAALMGVINEPQMFRCAIDQLGPTDLVRMITSTEADYNRRSGSAADQRIEQRLKDTIGDSDDPLQRRQMEATSPRLQAHKVKVPVQLIYGTSDWRVPLEHGTSMRDALQAAGAVFEWKSYAGEGHGIWDRANQADLYTRTGQFLARQLGAADAK